MTIGRIVVAMLIIVLIGSVWYSAAIPVKVQRVSSEARGNIVISTPPQSYPPPVQQPQQQYQPYYPPYQQPVPPAQQAGPTLTAYVAHGDILNPPDGRCYVKVFYGQAPFGLGSGTYRTETVTGTSWQIQQRVQQIAQGSAQHAGMPCPVIG